MPQSNHTPQANPASFSQTTAGATDPAKLDQFVRLSPVLHQGGLFFVGTQRPARPGEKLKDVPIIAAPFIDPSQAATHCLTQPRGTGLFFTPSTFVEPWYLSEKHKRMVGFRKRVNVRASCALWIDWDVRPDLDAEEIPRSFKSLADAEAALARLVALLGLEPTITVRSGGGLHTYWVVDEALPWPRWKPLASALGALLKNHGIAHDVQCTSDITRWLRVPGGFNWKLDQPRPIEVLDVTRVYATGELERALGGPFEPVQMGWRAPSADDDRELDDPAALVGRCAQVRRSFEQGGRRDYEPMWFAMAGLAQQCSDGWEFFKLLSKQHPDFDEAAARDKLSRTDLKVSTCEHLDRLRGGICPGCERWPRKGVPIERKFTELHESVARAFSADLRDCYRTTLTLHGKKAARKALDEYIIELRRAFPKEGYATAGKIMAFAAQHWPDHRLVTNVGTTLGWNQASAERFAAKLVRRERR